jgi:hypothetical protein
MTQVVLLLLPVALMSLAVQCLFLAELWRTRHERPGFGDLHWRDQVILAGSACQQSL